MAILLCDFGCTTIFMVVYIKRQGLFQGRVIEFFFKLEILVYSSVIIKPIVFETLNSQGLDATFIDKTETQITINITPLEYRKINYWKDNIFLKISF